jgi:hypothetical protein
MKTRIKFFYYQSRIRLLLVLISLVMLVMVQSCTRLNDKGILRVGEEGNVNYIIIPDQSDPIIQFAASELKSYLNKITGQELQIVKTSDNKGKTKAIQLILDHDKSLKWDGYKIKCSPNGIRLESVQPRGLLYAVYSLLEESGCSFFYPGEKEEIVPHRSTISFKMDTIVFNPVLEHRGLAPYGLQANSVALGRNFIDWMSKNRLNYILVSEDRPSDSDGPAHGSIWKEVSKELLPELQKRGFVIEMSEHCAPVFFPRSLFKDHPDWFAMKNGERKLGPPPYSGQMCYSNKEAVEYYASAIAEYAAKHPEFHVIGTWPLDGGEYCECELCKDPQTVFKAAMRVAAKVKLVRPDMIVEHLAYNVQTWQPPDMEIIPDNMSVLWCPDAGVMNNLASEWVKKADHAGGFYQFEYYMGDNYRSRSNVLLRPSYSVQVARHASEMGFRGVISLFLPMQNWWRSSFNNWFFARACWDANLDIQSCIRKYCHDYYGEQASKVEQIFNIILTVLPPKPYSEQLKKASIRLPEMRAYSKNILTKLDSLTNATKEKDVALRLQRIKAYVEYNLLDAEAMASGKPEDFKRLCNYSKEHPEEEMVLMYPGYISWRNQD